jgi:hypothetical protein
MFPSSGARGNAYSVGSLRKSGRWLWLALSKGPNRVGISPHTWGWHQIQFPKRSVLNNWTMDTVQKLSNSECHTPLSEPFKIYTGSVLWGEWGSWRETLWVIPVWRCFSLYCQQIPGHCTWGVWEQNTQQRTLASWSPWFYHSDFYLQGNVYKKSYCYHQNFSEWNTTCNCFSSHGIISAYVAEVVYVLHGML